MLLHWKVENRVLRVVGVATQPLDRPAHRGNTLPQRWTMQAQFAFWQTREWPFTIGFTMQLLFLIPFLADVKNPFPILAGSGLKGAHVLICALASPLVRDSPT